MRKFSWKILNIQLLMRLLFAKRQIAIDIRHVRREFRPFFINLQSVSKILMNEAR